MEIDDIKKAVASIAMTMRENRDFLVHLDQQNGDGDLGISMATGYTAISEYLATSQETDLGKALAKCSMIFNETAPSTLGTITSLGFMALAKALKGKTTASLDEIASAMEFMNTQIMEKAKSKPGDKTILDSIVPATAALKIHCGESWREAFRFAAEAAAEGSEQTKAMRPVHGRAAYYGEKSIGMIDGGSVVGRLIFESIYRTCADIVSR
jgi:dihydroxyacetone kinase-like protein